MWLTCLPWGFITKMWGATGLINQRLDGKDCTYRHRKTSIGEGLRFYAYMLSIACQPGLPVKAMWKRSWDAGEKRTVPPPKMGRFGMSENRFCHLKSLASHMHSVSEAELDSDDPWRYCTLPIEEHNKHWEEVLTPSWLLGPDEAMSP